jgi:ubiquinone/menaquinone biosynthesis C-methylase UbiE
MTEPQLANDYNSFAGEYATHNESSPYNAYYERPAVLDLLGDVAGRRVLDAGCGSGATALALRERGAEIAGIDLSEGLLQIARGKLGPEVSLQQADLSQPLPFSCGRFDLVLASLVLHYLDDWTVPLREFRRILVPGGLAVVSTGHPFADFQFSGSDNYLATEPFEDRWNVSGRETTMRMRFWRRPLSAMTEAFTAAGFRIETIAEPKPLAEARELFPADYQTLMKRPAFIFFALRAS